MYTFKKIKSPELHSTIIVCISYEHHENLEQIKKITNSSEEVNIPYDNWKIELNKFLIAFDFAKKEIENLNKNNEYIPKSIQSLKTKYSDISVPLLLNFNNKKEICPMSIYEIEHFDENGVRSLIEFEKISKKIQAF